MKTMICLIGLATLVLTNGCASRTPDRGGAYDSMEFQSGQTVSSESTRSYYWDQNGHYHEGMDRQY